MNIASFGRGGGSILTRSALALPLLVVLVLLGVVPLFTLILTSLWHNTPFSVVHTISFENYSNLVRGDTGTAFLRVLRSSFLLTIAVTVVALLIGFPTAFYLSQRVGRTGSLVLLLLYIPLTTSYLVKVYAWRGLLDDRGLINYTLMKIGVIDHPLSFLLYNRFSVGLALLGAVLPFVILPMYAALERVPRNFLEAAADLGGSQLFVFRRVLVPLCRRGIVAGATFAFVACIGDFIASQFLGGTSGLMVSRLIYGYFGVTSNPPQGAAMAVVVIVITMIVLGLLSLVTRLGGGKASVPLDSQLTR